jgi:hypothetical protein
MSTPPSEEVVDEVFRRWERRHPDEAAVDGDPTSLRPCEGCDMTFAWRGYEPYCGWCHEDQGAGTD